MDKKFIGGEARPRAGLIQIVAKSLFALLLAFALTNCSGGSPSAAPASPPPSPPPPSITAQPSSETVAVTKTATFSVTATGTPPFLYQWLEDNKAIPGATSASYTTPPTTAADNGSTFQVMVSNPGGTTPSNTVTLTVDSPPTITVQPADETVALTKTATFSVTATGAAPLSYQWFKGNNLIANATSSTYTTPPTTAADSGDTFQVQVTNPGGMTPSNTATLTVDPPPSITSQPQSEIVDVTKTATFSVSATGVSALSYQWQKNGVSISGATSASYTTPPTTAADNGAMFQVLVTDLGGTTPSSSAALTVDSPPTVTSVAPNNGPVAGGTGVTITGTNFAAGATVTFGGTAATNVAVVSATQITATTPAGSAGAVTVAVTVKGQAGSLASGFTYVAPPTVTNVAPNNGPVAGGTGVTITGTNFAAGATVTFGGTAATNVAVVSATQITATTPAGSAGAVTVAVTVNGQAGSLASGFTYVAPPTITTQPVNQIVAVGNPAMFSVVASGTAPLTYQWQMNGTAISGATSASYTTPATTAADDGAMFQVLATNPGGTTPSSIVTLTVTGTGTAVSVTTSRYDNSRSGQNTNETTLTPSNVNSTQFGKLFTQQVDGQVYAQPLYIPSLTVNGAVHNVIFVATQNDSVFAFDADSNTGSNANPLWQADLIDTAHGAAAGAAVVTNSEVSCNDISPIIGVTATPVIDPTTNTMYVVAKSAESGGYVLRLHSLDITTGAEKAPGPVVIDATVSGTGDGSSGGQIVFSQLALYHNSRPGLLLMNGTVYIAFASHCDNTPYHGWLFAYSASTFAQQGVFNTTANGGLGGFWMSGTGIAADSSGNIFIASGNGTFDTSNTPATMFGDTILKLALSGNNLALEDYFTPYNQANLSANDTDLGSGGVLLLPDQPGNFPHLLVEVGKQGTIYLVNRDQMTTNNTHYCASGCDSDPEIVQELPSAIGGLWSSPTYWNNAVYFWGEGDVLKAYSLTNGLLSSTPVSTGSLGAGYPSINPIISSNGAIDGILWAIGHSGSTAILYAYDPTNVANEFYDSTQAANNRDVPGGYVKFAVPVVTNGKVYIGTANELDVYGLL